MSESGFNESFGRYCNKKKEHIKHALKGELYCGDDANGPVYFEKAPWSECKAYILKSFDELVYQAKMALDTSRALEKVATMKYGFSVKNDFAEYLEAIEEERKKFNDYHYEDDVLWLLR